MKKSFLSLLFIIPLLVTCGNFTEAQAAEGDVGYSVQAHIPANQIDKRQTYFDLKMQPKQKQTVEIDVLNSSNEEIQVEAAINYASTNRTGIIDYTKNDLTKKDKSLKYPLPELAEIPDDQKRLTIPVNGKKTVQVMIEMPAESIDGVVLGAVEFKKKNTKETKKTKGVSLKNEYSYIVGMQLAESDKQVKPHMNLLSIKPALLNYHTAIVANLQNDQPVILENLSIDAKVYQQNSDKLLYQTKKANMKMAPNSNFNYSVDWENQELKPGKYKVHLVAKNKEDKWEWTKEFTISSDQAKKANKAALGLEKDYTWMYIVGGVLLFILLIITTYFVGKRAAKKKQENEK
ncbi:hypothetical protein AWJ02_07490 [Listeria monocytogenes]|uniref:DUF916 and DUF3324 domain-containing protein n=1 Tax=Listeria monocytogenes TaxID=1639 RepID=UPI000775CB59|nr:DUF916 and DUF3324 domain-containing protein [Listeria monocytogenes]KXS57681.1 hypothetical protein AWJ03_13640 [Listeria monocytogenes]KXS64367.1 hypothetical protein AWJ02_07490 [Listeria monocytogenes]